MTATATGVYCFTYSGVMTPVGGLGALFAPTVTAVNALQLPAGNYLSWFRLAPALASLQSLSPGQVVCVAAPVGTNVFPSPPTSADRGSAREERRRNPDR